MFVSIDVLFVNKAYRKHSSHNTVTMSWGLAPATISIFLTLEDIKKALEETNDVSPILKLVSEARSKGYDNVCLPLTTDKWRQRWTEMCIQTLEGDNHKHDMVVERRAEEWRSRPAFLKDEVTMTRLGQYLLQYCSKCKQRFTQMRPRESLQ